MGCHGERSCSRAACLKEEVHCVNLIFFPQQRWIRGLQPDKRSIWFAVRVVPQCSEGSIGAGILVWAPVGHNMSQSGQTKDMPRQPTWNDLASNAV